MQEVKNMENVVKDIDKKIKNIVKAVEQSGSLAMLNRLNELEEEKSNAVHNLAMVENDLKICQVSKDEILQAFKKARELLESKAMPNIQELVNTFVDKVAIFCDRVEISFNLGFKTEVFKDILSEITEESPENKKTISQEKSCETALGGEGSSPRIATLPIVQGEVFIISINRSGYIEKRPDWDNVNRCLTKLA